MNWRECGASPINLMLRTHQPGASALPPFQFIRFNCRAARLWVSTVPQLRDGYAAEIITELDLSTAGICTIVWAMGHAWDFSLVELPVRDSDGYPVQARSVSQYPGLISLDYTGCTRENQRCSLAWAKTQLIWLNRSPPCGDTSI